jgi:N-acetylmuramoyl-L-alanine amidase
MRLKDNFATWAVLVLGLLFMITVHRWVTENWLQTEHVSPLSDLYTEEPDIEMADGYRPGRITYLFIHCTATTADWDKERLLRFFREGRGWSKPGYHYYVRKSGQVDTLVALDSDNFISYKELAYGATGYNSRSIHISYAGGIDRTGRPMDTRTPQQRAAIASLVSNIRKAYPHIQVNGHRAVARKACPSFDAAKEYGGPGDSARYEQVLRGL